MIKKYLLHCNGFTLIELMVVISIIGLLSAIAIPNFIAYRDKAFCSASESDAISISHAMSEYFSIPTVTTCSKAALLGTNATGKIFALETFSNLNTWTLNASDLNNIIISVTDVKSRCPNSYRAAMSSDVSPRGYWKGFNYIKTISK